MKTLTIKKLILSLLVFLNLNQSRDERIASDYSFDSNTIPTEFKEPLELIILRNSIEDYSSKMEIIGSEIDFKLQLKKHPYRTTK